MDADDHFDFDDDGFDSFDADTLQQLEASAIRATQRQSRDADESDYGVDEDDGDIIDLNNQPAAPRPGAWDAPAVAHGHAPPQHHRPLHTGHHTNGSTGDGAAASHDAMDVEELPRQSQADVGQLLLRIKKLEQEKARSKRDLESERARLIQESGKAETARRRLENERKEHAQKMSAMQQSYSEATAKQKADLEKIRKESEQAKTNNQFLEHEMAREADRSRRMKRPPQNGASKPRQPSVASPAVTPKKQGRTLPFRDGFDDDDIVMLSPSKNRDRSKPSTPKQTKRKRQITDQSPVAALQLSEPRDPPQAAESFATIDSVEPHVAAGFPRDDRRFALLHHLVNNRSSNGTDRVLEALAQYALPSKPNKKLSSVVHDELLLFDVQSNVRDLAVKICHIFLAMWKQCLQEKYYDPIFLFLDAVQFVLAYEPCSTAVALIDRAVPILVETIELVSIPIARADMYAHELKNLYTPKQRRINEKIDALNCLRLLHLIATSSVTSPEAATTFWQSIPVEFSLVLLKARQPIEGLHLYFRILATSSLPNTLGSILPASQGPDKQRARESDLIDRLMMLLFEKLSLIPDPQHPTPGSHDYTPSQIATLRIHILSLLTTFSLRPHGSARLASLRLAIPRLIKHLHESITQLYTRPLAPTRPQTITSINSTMKLIAHLKATNPDLDIKTKLAAVPGTEHKYLVALTRLAFSEGLVLEEGIEEEVVDAAHAILDEGLSPEEGEGLLCVFPGTGGSA